MIHKLLDTTTAAFPTGLPTQKKIFRIASGAFAGRLLVLYARAPANLALVWVDAPYTAWSAPVNFVTESDDLPFAAVMDASGNAHVAYTQTGTGALRSIKLTFLNGSWAPQTAVTIYDSASSASRYPSIIRDAYNRLWVAWTRDDSGTYTTRAKSSSDDGATWGSGSTDAGTDLSGNTTASYGTLVARPTHVHCLFTVAGTDLRHRKIHLDAALWDSAEVLYTGTGLGSDLSGAAAPDGTLGALFVADSKLFLKEFDGAVWGALQTVLNSAALSPSLRHLGNTPYALFLQSIGTDQNLLFESHRSGAAFTLPTPVLSQQATLASLFCYDADAPAPYAELTSQAASTLGADVFHPTSGGLIKSINDAVYYGADDRFAFLRVLLSQNGSGGVVAFSYWNGAAWSDFTPASGAYDFSAGNKGIRLFTDGNSTPSDWQKSVVNGANRYWIRALCTTAFTTTPIGSQITAVPKTTHASLW